MHLGSLEKQVLLYLWEHGQTCVKDAYKEIREQRGGSLNALQSAFERLYKKGLLSREKIKYAYFYQTVVDKSTFLANEIKSISQEYGEAENLSILTSFISTSDNINNQQLDHLEALIQQKRQMTKQKD